MEMLSSWEVYMRTPFIKFKQEKQGTTLMYLHPLLVMVMFDMSYWCSMNNIDFVVTDTISTIKKDIKLGRKHSGHRRAVAFDVRSRTFSEEQQEKFIEIFNDRYNHIAQISESDLVARLVVLHGEGDNEHFHVGINYRFGIEEK